MAGDVQLRIILQANGVEVASSENPKIWLSAMSQITGVSALAPAEAAAPIPNEKGQGRAATPNGGPAAKLAADLGISEDELEGAAGPSTQAPFIHLDHKYWEALRNNEGYARTPPTVLAATLLLLWDRHAKIGDVSLSTCSLILKDIGLTTKNASRSFRNCDWLLLRGNLIKLNPAQISKAEQLAAAYCRRGAS